MVSKRIKIGLLLICFLVISVSRAEDDSNSGFWKRSAQQNLKNMLNRVQNENVAKNVIIFIGDGMGIPTITAARIRKGQNEGQRGEENLLSFEKFPYTALIKTYNVDRQVPDSAATATAIFTGIKANYETLAVSPASTPKDCNSTFGEELTSILQWAQNEGKSTGIVTNTRLTHATPAALYSRSAHRNWESDIRKPDNASRCLDIASQMVETEPGKNAQVILGGGRKCFISRNDTDPKGNAGERKDGKNLVNAWLAQKGDSKAIYVSNTQELIKVDSSQTDYLLGMFSSDHLDYEVDRNKTSQGQPSLEQMTEKALEILKKNPKGFFLMVEGGRVDHAHHANLAHKALEEAIMLDKTVKKALSMCSESDTLFIVTADHSHVMTMNGYPKRGNPILGLGDVSDIDLLPYTTLMYTTGPAATNETFVARQKLSSTDTNATMYRPLALVPLSDETHGGEDVALYATGPMAHLFQGVQEQNYIAHAAAYASCLGEIKDHCDVNASPTLPPYSVLTLLALSYACS